MLDKSVPYVDILMRRAASEKPPSVPLPEGYRFTFFKAGDEADWARIETSVLEFDCEMDALLYFQREYLPCLAELGRRCLFIEAPDYRGVGVPISLSRSPHRRRTGTPA